MQIGSKNGSDGAALLHQQASLSRRGSAAGRHDGPGFDPPVHPDMWQGAAPAQRTTRWFAGRWLVGGRSGPVWAAGRGRLDCGAGEGRTLAATGDDRCVFVGRLGASTHGEAAATCVCGQLTAAAGWVWCSFSPAGRLRRLLRHQRAQLGPGVEPGQALWSACRLGRLAPIHLYLSPLPSGRSEAPANRRVTAFRRLIFRLKIVHRKFSGPLLSP